MLAHGWWFSPGTTASSTTKIGRHDIAEILLKVVLSTKKSINVFIQDLGTYKHKTAHIIFTYIFFRNIYLRQPSTDFDFWNLTYSGDVVSKEHWWHNTSCLLIYFTILWAQNAIKVENISNLIASQYSNT